MDANAFCAPQFRRRKDHTLQYTLKLESCHCFKGWCGHTWRGCVMMQRHSFEHSLGIRMHVRKFQIHVSSLDDPTFECQNEMSQQMTFLRVKLICLLRIRSEQTLRKERTLCFLQHVWTKLEKIEGYLSLRLSIPRISSNVKWWERARRRHDGKESKREHSWNQHNRPKYYLLASVCMWLHLARIASNIWHAPYYLQ